MGPVVSKTRVDFALFFIFQTDQITATNLEALLVRAIRAGIGKILNCFEVVTPLARPAGAGGERCFLGCGNARRSSSCWPRRPRCARRVRRLEGSGPCPPSLRGTRATCTKGPGCTRKVENEKNPRRRFNHLCMKKKMVILTVHKRKGVSSLSSDRRFLS